MAKRGRKPKKWNVTCHNKRCKFFGKRGQGNIVSNGTYRTRSTGKVRLFLCRACGKAFCSRRGTVFYDIRTPKKKVFMALKLLVKEMSLRGTAEVMEVKLDTVRGWLRLPGIVSGLVIFLLKISISSKFR